MKRDLTTPTGRAILDPMSTAYIGHLGRQASDFDNTFAENAEMTAPLPQKPLSIAFIAACIILPLGLFVLAGTLIHRHLKG
jgi:hypothetical protein